MPPPGHIHQSAGRVVIEPLIRALGDLLGIAEVSYYAENKVPLVGDVEWRYESRELTPTGRLALCSADGAITGRNPWDRSILISVEVVLSTSLPAARTKLETGVLRDTFGLGLMIVPRACRDSSEEPFHSMQLDIEWFGKDSNKVGDIETGAATIVITQDSQSRNPSRDDATSPPPVAVQILPDGKISIPASNFVRYKTQFAPLSAPDKVVIRETDFWGRDEAGRFFAICCVENGQLLRLKGGGGRV